MAKNYNKTTKPKTKSNEPNHCQKTLNIQINDDPKVWEDFSKIISLMDFSSNTDSRPEWARRDPWDYFENNLREDRVAETKKENNVITKIKNFFKKALNLN